MKIRAIFCAAAVLAVASSPLRLDAQVTEGQRIRIISPANGYFEPTGGTVLLVMPDSIVLGIRTLQHTIALEDIDRLQVSAGKNSRVGEVGLGALAGFTTGFLAGWLHHSITGPIEDAPDYVKANYEDRRPMFLVGGGVIGVLLGFFMPGDRWQSVPVDVAVGGQGTAVVVSHRF